ncbi:MAG: Ig-like domain-containing protein [Acidobacteria bacterium]|nr:Ig-like domain-containing protein [Acidobacteriota bacterium]
MECDQSVVLLALDHLKQAHLLTSEDSGTVSRRAALRKVASIAAAGMVLPVVASIPAPLAAMARSARTTTTTSTSTTTPMSTTTLVPVGTVHLANMAAQETNQQNPSRWTATVLVTARDGNGDLVAGAKVDGGWNPGGINSPTCTTEATGQCTVSQVDMHRTGANTVLEATFTMSVITHPELDYAPGDDEVPLSITIQKP